MYKVWIYARIYHPEKNNMHIKSSMIAVLSLFCMLFASSSAFACACCAEHGTYSLWKVAPDSYHLGVIKEIEFGKTAQLYMTEAGFESIRGLSSIEKEMNSDTTSDLSIVDAFTRNTWHIEIKTHGGKSGTLLLPRPAKMTIFKVDTHENDAAGGEAMLYKEFQFNGTVGSGSGIFRSSIVRPTTYSLVFQGRGNECDNAADFTHWRLEVSGTKASYAFFGKLGSS